MRYSRRAKLVSALNFLRFHLICFKDEFEMSYIIAFVSFGLRGSAYRFNCFRDDVHAGDEVLVRLGNGTYRPGTVERTEFLDWRCEGAVVCKLSEAVKGDSGYSPGPGANPHRGLTSNHAMIHHLEQHGWISFGHGKNFKALCGFHNGSERAHIWFTNRSIRLEILDEPDPLPAPGSFVGAKPNAARQVMHHFSQTTFNLYEGVARFAEAFQKDSGDYQRFFKAVGSKSRQPPELARERRLMNKERDEMSDLYDAMGGDGGSVYLSDGLYLGPGGKLRDW